MRNAFKRFSPPRKLLFTNEVAAVGAFYILWDGMQLKPLKNSEAAENNEREKALNVRKN